MWWGAHRDNLLQGWMDGRFGTRRNGFVRPFFTIRHSGQKDPRWKRSEEQLRRPAPTRAHDRFVTYGAHFYGPSTFLRNILVLKKSRKKKSVTLWRREGEREKMRAAIEYFGSSGILLSWQWLTCSRCKKNALRSYEIGSNGNLDIYRIFVVWALLDEPLHTERSFQLMTLPYQFHWQSLL